jgi:hypothetical protein
MCKHMVTSCSVRLGMRNIAEKNCRKTQKNFVCNKLSENRAVSDHVKKYGTARQTIADSIIWHMRFACWLQA